MLFNIAMARATALRTPAKVYIPGEGIFIILSADGRIILREGFTEAAMDRKDWEFAKQVES